MSYISIVFTVHGKWLLIKANKIYDISLWHMHASDILFDTNKSYMYILWYVTQCLISHGFIDIKKSLDSLIIVHVWTLYKKHTVHQYTICKQSK